MIGKIYTSRVEFYDIKTNKTLTKFRPVLILTDTRNNDYTVLPISTISKKDNIDLQYDVKVDPMDYPNLLLKKVSYIRTHKRIYVHRASVVSEKSLGDIKNDYPILYKEIIDKTDKFNKEVISIATK